MRKAASKGHKLVFVHRLDTRSPGPAARRSPGARRRQGLGVAGGRLGPLCIAGVEPRAGRRALMRPVLSNRASDRAAGVTTNFNELEVVPGPGSAATSSLRLSGLSSCSAARELQVGLEIPRRPGQLGFRVRGRRVVHKNRDGPGVSKPDSEPPRCAARRSPDRVGGVAASRISET